MGGCALNVTVPSTVMPGLVPGIHAFIAPLPQDVDGRNKCGHDEQVNLWANAKERAL